MIQPDNHTVDLAVEAMLEALAPLTMLDWTVRAGTLEWSCWETGAHIAHDLVAYATQLTAQPSSAYLSADFVVRAGTLPTDLVAIIAGAGHLLSTVVASAGPGDRGWHWGPTDRSGFAALGITEILMHTHDIVMGFDTDWAAPAELCAACIDRLFPEAPDTEPELSLLWSTGRIALNDRPRRTSWVPRAACE